MGNSQGMATRGTLWSTLALLALVALAHGATPAHEDDVTSLESGKQVPPQVAQVLGKDPQLSNEMVKLKDALENDQRDSVEFEETLHPRLGEMNATADAPLQYPPPKLNPNATCPQIGNPACGNSSNTTAPPLNNSSMLQDADLSLE